MPHGLTPALYGVDDMGSRLDPLLPLFALRLLTPDP